MKSTTKWFIGWVAKNSFLSIAATVACFSPIWLYIIAKNMEHSGFILKYLASNNIIAIVIAIVIQIILFVGWTDLLFTIWQSD